MTCGKLVTKKVDPTIERTEWLAHKDSDLDPPCIDYWEIVEPEAGGARSEEVGHWGYVPGCHHC